jgi:hypothetical protein
VEVARLFPLERSQRVLNLVILRVLGPDIIVDASSFLQDILVHVPLYTLYISCLAIVLQPTLCSRSINSASGLSARYLTLFHENVRRY